MTTTTKKKIEKTEQREKIKEREKEELKESDKTELERGDVHIEGGRERTPKKYLREGVRGGPTRALLGSVCKRRRCATRTRVGRPAAHKHTRAHLDIFGVQNLPRFNIRDAVLRQDVATTHKGSKGRSHASRLVGLQRVASGVVAIG